MKSFLLKFARDERGATAIEYGIIAGLMAVVLVASFGSGESSLTTRLKETFTGIASTLSTANTPASTTPATPK
jgi:pilus assembly protein Flp/PilA